MALIKRTLLFISNVLAVVALLALLAGAGWGAWQIMPQATRDAIADPRGVADATRRGIRNGPTNPIVALTDWLRNWLAERRDLVDTVRAADGSSDGIIPLPAWTSVDSRRVFGATETLWQPRRAKLSGARWSRIFFSWSDIQPGGPRDWRAYYNIRDSVVRRERDNGVELVGLLINTPRWAAARPQDGVHSVPAGLDRPLNDPTNTWAAFVRKMAADYRGRVDTWVVWNEPDIRPGGTNAQYFTWAGDERDYALLLKTAYLAARQGNPNAKIVFAGTTYWAVANANQPLFLERVLSILAEDPQARAAGFYFDAVGLNLYSSPDDIVRVGRLYRDVLERYGLSTPLWMTEMNATPYDDPTPGLAHASNGFRVTMEEQASYVTQAYALGLSAGYARMAFHSMTDRDTQDELWGLVRNDGSLRPAFVAYQTAARYMGGATRAVFAGRERAEWRWPRNGYVPNWQVYLVAFERPSGPLPPLPPAPPAGGSAAAAPEIPAPDGPAADQPQRVSVLWNGDPEPLRVAVPRTSSRAAAVDKYGRLVPLEATESTWIVALPPATARSPLDPDGFYFIGGSPILLVESGVPDGAPVVPPTVLA
jgi:hypothetical protein